MVSWTSACLGDFCCFEDIPSGIPLCVACVWHTGDGVGSARTREGFVTVCWMKYRVKGIFHVLFSAAPRRLALVVLE